MTDPTNDDAQAERIRRLQERRSVAGRSSRATATGGASAAEPRGTSARAATGPPNRKLRRRHPAAPTRWMLAGLSIFSFFGIAGTIAAANVNAVATAAPTAASAPAAPTASAATTTVKAAPAPTTAKAPAAHTTSGGS